MSPKKQSKSIRKHMIVGAVLVQVLLLPAFIYVVATLTKEQIQNQFISNLQGHTSLTLKRVENNWGNENKIDRILAQETVMPHVAYIYIIDAQKNLLFRKGLTPPHETFQQDNHFDQHNDGIFDVSLPLNIADNDISPTLYMGFNENHSLHLITYIQQRLIYFTVIYFLVSAFMTALFTKTLTQPLKDISAAIRNVTRGNPYDEIYTHSTIKEINDLAQDLNAMRKDLISKTQKLRHQATHDTLTGLPNRALCMDRISQTMALSQRKRKAFVLLMLDLDQFKEINDTLGHKAGDMLLEVTASRLIRIVRKSDSVARLGGDEFAILLPTADASQASIVAQKALKSIQKSFHFEEHTLHINASIGAAIYPDHGKTVGELLHSADTAMYHAKRGGHGFTMHHTQLINNNTGALTLSSDLEDALEQEEIVLYFQPKLDMASNTITGVETLIRWQHHKRGLLFPDEFIPAAENSGIIDKLTRYVVSKSIQQCIEWLQAGFDFTIAVNISAKNLLDPQFSNTVFRLLEHYDLSPKYLEIELTESAVMNDPDLAKETLSKLSNKGIKISLDDFGAGNTSLSHFLELPLNIIKIDKSFITDIARNANRQSIVHRIIELAHALELQTVIEGVEDQQVLQLIEKLGGDAVQGYVLTKPLPSTDFILWLKQQSRWKYTHPSSPPTNTEIII